MKPGKQFAWGSLGLGLLIGLAVFPVTQTFNYLTLADAFCGSSCHSMQHLSSDPIYQHSRHRINPSGVVAGCKDCHLPAGLIAETWVHVQNGTHDLIVLNNVSSLI